ncbi:phytoene desaturase family protein [Paenibacillus hamazuiensis]|uniref:phytoene desaturase family protein n=1 Tax=Paenibacillus hamazuiensis TaxID=2936508 RepID=UPI002010B585|nr:FAD-dependent oxidoreductase [Paenibacillus hamazuiensis]
MDKFDVAIVGGGIAGLTAAVYLAKAGRKVAVLEKLGRFGGRADTITKNGVKLNLGGHALYRGGEACDILQEFGITLEGGIPSVKTYGLWKNESYLVPTGMMSMISFPLLSVSGKMEFARFMMKLSKIDVHAVPKVSLREWTEREVRDPMVRHLFYALTRTATYVNDPDLLWAQSTIKQLKRALTESVLYVDGGWETIVSKLRLLAENHGAAMLPGKNAAEIVHENGRVSQVRCSDGTLLAADAVIVTASPAEVFRMVKGAEHTSLRKWKEQALPIKAACLDLGLRRLPNPEHQFAMGIDQPLLFTNQSRAAKLSDDGTAVVHLLKYNGVHNGDSKADEAMLEKALDTLHPGWRKEVAVRQYLPNITVLQDFEHTGRKESPGPAVPQIGGLYVAGDWAGHGELLVDASFASARRAALHILQTVPALH